MNADMIPVGTAFTFHGPYDQLAERKGQEATVVEHITEDNGEVEVSEVGPMYIIQFKDGFKTHAWPEEVEDLGI